MSNPLVSVGMPVYNRPEPMRKAIDSILNQTYRNLEIIISNDASPNPEVYKILDEYAARDPRIKLTHQPIDLGCYGNYYWVLQQASGPYFMYGQDDDTWEPMFVEEMVKVLEGNSEDVVAISAVRYFGKDGIYATYRFNNETILSLMMGEKIPFLWMGLWRLASLKLFDKDADDVHGKDIVIVAEAILSHSWGYSDMILYNKTLYYDKALDYVRKYPLCYLQMYKHVITRTVGSPYISFKTKLKLAIILPAFGLRVIQMYLAQPVFLLGFYHWFRTKARAKYNRWYAND